MTDAEAGEFDGRAICRECGDDLAESLTRFDVIEWCEKCAGVGVTLQRGDHDDQRSGQVGG